MGASFAWGASEKCEDKDGKTTSVVAKRGPMDYFALGIDILGLARQFGGMLKKA